MKCGNVQTGIARWTGCFLLLALVTASLGGCLFEPREPELPSSGDSITYLPRSVAKNVWANIQLALNNSDRSGYEEAISEDFQYFPDNDADQQFPGLFDDWNQEKELNFITRFFDSDVTIDSVMRDEDFVVPDPAGNDVVPWVGVIYYLKVKSNSDNSESRYRASATITFRLEDNFWYITEWREQQGESDPDNTSQILSSMGVLRGIFGSE